MISKFNPLKNAGKGCDIYGKDRLSLALIVKKILNRLKVDWIIESGTLLGAYRSKKFIPHDDDFDIAIIFQNKNSVKNINNICSKIRLQLPKPLECRIIDTYSDKIEVYDPTKGKYILAAPRYNGADYYNVIVDIQAFYCNEHMNIISTYRIAPTSLIYDYDSIYPIKNIKLEDNIFNSPNNVEKFLETTYGYLGADAKYNPSSGKYIKIL